MAACVKGFTLKCCAVLCAAFILLSLCVFPTALAEDGVKIVRVGYVQLTGFLYKDANGAYSGLAYDLLNEIATYCGWKYEFIETTYSECRALLASGAIDICVPYQKTAERAEIYEYSNEIFCQNTAALLTSPDADIYYNDFAAMDGITIGVAKGTRNGQRFADYLAENDAGVTIKQEYSSQAALVAAMQAGEIDAFVSASNRGIADCKIISVLDTTDSYVIAKKGSRKVLDKIDAAIRQIHENMPGFWKSLDEKYRITNSGAYPSLTREEATYIAEKGSVSVLLSAQECDADGNFASGAKVMYDELSKLTGLEFLPVVSDGIHDIYDSFANGAADVMYSFNHDYEWASMHNAVLTQSYSTFYASLIKKPTTTDINTVALVDGTYLAYYMRKNYSCDTVACASYKDAIELVLDGTADATYCNSPIANYYSTFPKYRSLNFVASYNLQSSFCMGVSTQCSPLLVNIIDKALGCIPSSVMLAAFDTQAGSRSSQLADFFYINPRLTIAVICFVAILLFALITSILFALYARNKNHQLQEANNAKTDFLSRMSHDMRTPMNGILGVTALARDETDMAEIKKGLEQIDISGKYLLNLINDTLDVSKIEAGKIELRVRPMDTAKVMSNAIGTAQVLAGEKGVHLDIKLPQMPQGGWKCVMADSSRVEQIFMNIISNAIKFTPRGGTVTFEMKTEDITADTVRDTYIISDTGIGMSHEFLQHIYEPFSQEGRAHTNGTEGTGLGMSIVKQLVEMMGGTIKIESELNRGTRVTISLSYKIAKDAAADAAPAAGLGILLGKHVLLCEDHPLNTQIAVRMLEKCGVTVDAAENGQVGADKFAASPQGTYAAVLMDIRMPVMGGIEAARTIRAMQRPDAKTVPIIAMTANAFDEDVQNCLDAGMNAHIAKPVDPQALYQTLANEIRKA